MSFVKRSESEKPPRKPRPKAAPMWVTKPLDNGQKAKLSIAARDAYKIQSEHGLTDTDFDSWRHSEINVATGGQCSGLREATNKHFRSILARFYALAGKTDEASAIWKRTGRVSGSDQLGDTHENREVCRAIIRDLIAASQGKIGDAYVAKICADKFSGATTLTATAAELQHLVFTLREKVKSKT